ncbi:MAG: bifunctional diguanylate cyclase/phosphodiesterase [Leptospirales bacterium]
MSEPIDQPVSPHPLLQSGILADVFNDFDVGVGLVDVNTGRYVLVNRKWCSLLGYSESELYRMTLREITFPEDWEKTLRMIQEVREGRLDRYTMEKRFVRKDRTVFWGLVIATIFEDQSGGASILNGVILDIDEKKRIEFQFQKEKDITRALSEINSLILKRPHPDLLFEESCRIAVEFGGFLATWVALVDLETLETRKKGLCLKGSAPLKSIENAIISVDPTKPHGQGSVGQAYRTGHPVIFNSYMEASATTYWHDEARKDGVGSVGSFPVRKGGRVVAVLVILSDRQGFFEPESISLLSKVADSISFGLDDYEKGQDLFLTSQVFDSVPEGILITDKDGVIRKVNESVTRLSGYLSSDLVGCRVDTLQKSPDKLDLLQMIRDSAERSITVERVFETLRKDDSSYMLEATVTPLLNRQSEIEHCVTIMKDVTSKVERESEIWRLANIDNLTGLLNRVALGKRLETEMAQSERSRSSLVLFFLDFDDFKAINDTMGHGVGDLFLQSIGTRLTSSVRSGDIVSRLGGDEFVIVLPLRNDLSYVASFVQGILDVVSAPVQINSRLIQATASIGIAIFPRDAADVDELLRKADIAMYQAKGKGKNMWQFFDPQMEVRIRSRFEQANQLKAALRDGSIILHYQPQVDVVRNRMTGVEALARWPQAAMEFSGPESFIPLAEETGIILPFGEWVLGEAFRTIRSWAESGRPRIRVAVNVSPRQFWSPSFWEFFGKKVLEVGDLTRWLTIELTEGLLMKDPEVAGHQLEWLRERDIRIAIDDFGTGYSSLGYLSRLAVDEIKVSQEFVMRMMKSPRDLLLVRTIIQMGKSLNIKLVGEGAQTKEEMRMLQELGCPVIQGYVLSHPLSREGLEEYWSGFPQES